MGAPPEGGRDDLKKINADRGAQLNEMGVYRAQRGLKADDVA